MGYYLPGDNELTHSPLVMPWYNVMDLNQQQFRPDSTKPLPEPMLTYYQWGAVAVTWITSGSFYKFKIHSDLCYEFDIFTNLKLQPYPSEANEWMQVKYRAHFTTLCHIVICLWYPYISTGYAIFCIYFLLQWNFLWQEPELKKPRVAGTGFGVRDGGVRKPGVGSRLQTAASAPKRGMMRRSVSTSALNKLGPSKSPFAMTSLRHWAVFSCDQAA